MKKVLMSICALLSAGMNADSGYIQVTNLTDKPISVAIYTHKKGERPQRSSAVHQIQPGYTVSNIIRPELSFGEKLKLTDRDMYFAKNPSNLGMDMPSKSTIRLRKQYFNVGDLQGTEFAIAPATNRTPDVNGTELVGGPKKEIEQELEASRKAAYQAGSLK